MIDGGIGVWTTIQKSGGIENDRVYSTEYFEIPTVSYLG
jgi:hypothetical protein